MDVAGITFTVGQGTVGESLADLKDGDVVRVRFSQAGRRQDRRNALIVEKVVGADE